MDNAVTNEVRRDKLAKYLKYGLALVGAAIISPFVFLAIKGLVGLIVAGFIALLAVNFAPVLGYKLANWKMKMIVEDAAANPIETMQNLFVEKSEELEKADNNIAEFDTEVRNYDDQLDGFKRQYPDEAATYQTISEKMHEALQDMLDQQKEARKALKDFSLKIQKAKAIYQMALAAQKVLTLSKSAESQVFSQIREQVAFDSVRTQLNRAFANLNMAVEKRSEARALNGTTTTALPALPAPTSNGLDTRVKVVTGEVVGGRHR